MSVDLANLGHAGICNRYDLDQLGLVDGFGLGRGKGSLQIDAPVGAEPDQALDGDDGAAPNEGPFRRLDVLFVTRGREVDGEEGGPHDQERPDVRV